MDLSKALTVMQDDVFGRLHAGKEVEDAMNKITFELGQVLARKIQLTEHLEELRVDVSLGGDNEDTLISLKAITEIVNLIETI